MRRRSWRGWRRGHKQRGMQLEVYISYPYEYNLDLRLLAIFRIIFFLNHLQRTAMLRRDYFECCLSTPRWMRMRWMNVTYLGDADGRIGGKKKDSQCLRELIIAYVLLKMASKGLRIGCFQRRCKYLLRSCTDGSQ